MGTLVPVSQYELQRLLLEVANRRRQSSCPTSRRSQPDEIASWGGVCLSLAFLAGEVQGVNISMYYSHLTM